MNVQTYHWGRTRVVAEGTLCSLYPVTNFWHSRKCIKYFNLSGLVKHYIERKVNILCKVWKKYAVWKNRCRIKTQYTQGKKRKKYTICNNKICKIHLTVEEKVTVSLYNGIYLIYYTCFIHLSVVIHINTSSSLEHNGIIASEAVCLLSDISDILSILLCNADSHCRFDWYTFGCLYHFFRQSISGYYSCVRSCFDTFLTPVP